MRSARELLERLLAAIGESWSTSFDPISLARDLRGMGFTQVEDFGPEEAKGRYFRDRKDGLRISGSSRLMKARIRSGGDL